VHKVPQGIYILFKFSGLLDVLLPLFNESEIIGGGILVLILILAILIPQNTILANEMGYAPGIATCLLFIVRALPTELIRRLKVGSRTVAQVL
jgi:hypothetical protein